MGERTDRSVYRLCGCLVRYVVGCLGLHTQPVVCCCAGGVVGVGPCGHLDSADLVLVGCGCVVFENCIVDASNLSFL